MIERATIDKIFDTADIVDVISDFVQLKKMGADYVGLCPFHNDKSPSFRVSPSKGIFKCFSCGKSGNTVSFIMEHEHLSYPKALKQIASKYSIPVEEDEPSKEEIAKRDERESLMVVNEFARKYFIKQLKEDERGRAVGLSYFRERGFTDQMIDKFELGFCPEGKDTFTNYALGKGYKLDFLQKTGLTIVKNDFRADRFSGRVIFPIHSISGRVVGFGGRILNTDKKTAKYLNSPESEVYHKSRVLFGLYQAKRAISRNDVCFLVEGYTDVISMHQRGIENVVASSGTALTEDQIRLIKRFTNNITIIYDGDEAGLNASLRSVDLIIQMNMNVRILTLPEGEDPDSFAKANSHDSIIEYIEKEKDDFIQFKAKLLKEQSKDDPIKKSEMINSIVRTISMIDDKVKQSLYVKSVSKKMEIDESVLYSTIKKFNLKKVKDRRKKERREALHSENQKTPTVPANVTNIYFEEHEKEIISLLLTFGNHEIKEADSETVSRTVAEYIISEIKNDELKFENLLYYKLFEEVDKIVSKGEKINKHHFINFHDPEIAKVSADLVTTKYYLHKFWEKRGSHIKKTEDKLSDYIPNLIHQYKRKVMQKAQHEIDKEIKNCDPEKVTELMNKKKKNHEIIKLLVKKQGIVIMK